MNVLIIDTYNLLHRARYSKFQKGNHFITYNFLKSFFYYLNTFTPDKVILAMDGFPKFRKDFYPEYKQNRIKQLDSEAEIELSFFKDQKKEIVSLLGNFPVELVYSENYEADDIIFTLVKEIYKDDAVTIISSDTDFIQIISDKCRVFSPSTSKFLEPTEYNYVYFKSFVGDPADNISGVSKVGKVTAAKILKSEESLNKWLIENKEKSKIFSRNVQLISFLTIPMEELDVVSGTYNLDNISYAFDKMEIKNMLSNKNLSILESLS
jgi:5'-3' exonuclease